VFGDEMPDFPTAESSLQAVCRSWLGPRTVVIEPLPGSGFSGAGVWRVRSGSDEWVLKSWTPGEIASGGADRIAWVHSLMRHLRRRGIDEVSEPRVALDGGSAVVDAEGTWWELLPFIPGTATDRPTGAQVTAAASCLARIHLAAESFAAGPRERCVPAALQRRMAAAQRLISSPWTSAEFRGTRQTFTPMQQAVVERLFQAMEVFAAGGGEQAIRRVAALRPPEMVVQAVVRDVWCDHVLYAEDDPSRVAGVIDLHAAAIDTPATDIARLVGSWQAESGRSPTANWATALEAYEAIRPLSEVERRWIPWLHATGVLFGLDNWFRWTLLESRGFVRPAQALSRLDRLIEQFPASLVDVVDPAVNAV
jgi:Ser/Thr protein kinase RdoA (MazF antagonist)